MDDGRDRVRSPSPLTPVRLLSGDDAESPAIPLPAGFSLFSADRLFLAFAHSRDAIAADAQADEVILRCARSPSSKRKVVLSRAARIGMTLHSNPNGRPAFQIVGILR